MKCENILIKNIKEVAVVTKNKTGFLAVWLRLTN